MSKFIVKDFQTLEALGITKDATEAITIVRNKLFEMRAKAPFSGKYHNSIEMEEEFWEYNQKLVESFKEYESGESPYWFGVPFLFDVIIEED